MKEREGREGRLVRNILTGRYFNGHTSQCPASPYHNNDKHPKIDNFSHPFDRDRPLVRARHKQRRRPHPLPPTSTTPPVVLLPTSSSLTSPIAFPLPEVFFFHLFLPLVLTRPLQCASQTSPSLPRTGPRSAYPLNSTTGVVCTLSLSHTFTPYQSSDFSPSTST